MSTKEYEMQFRGWRSHAAAWTTWRHITMGLSLAVTLLGGLGGCGWTEMWYEDPSFEEEKVPAGSLLVGVTFALEGDSTSGCAGRNGGMLVPGAPHDSVIVWVAFGPADPNYRLRRLTRQYDIQDVRIVLAGDTTKPRLCTDTAYVAYYPTYTNEPDQRRVWWHREYAAVASPWPAADSAVVCLDFITRDLDSGEEISREPVVRLLRKRSKSMLRDFLDGR